MDLPEAAQLHFAEVRARSRETAQRPASAASQG